VVPSRVRGPAHLSAVPAPRGQPGEETATHHNRLPRSPEATAHPRSQSRVGAATRTPPRQVAEKSRRPTGSSSKPPRRSRTESTPPPLSNAPITGIGHREPDTLAQNQTPHLPLHPYNRPCREGQAALRGDFPATPSPAGKNLCRPRTVRRPTLAPLPGRMRKRA